VLGFVEGGELVCGIGGGGVMLLVVCIGEIFVGV